MLKTSLVEYFDLDFCQNIIRSGSELKMLHVISQKGLLARQSAHGVYQYHSLFRDFLQQKAEEELSDKQELYQAFIQYYLKKIIMNGHYIFAASVRIGKEHRISFPR